MGELYYLLLSILLYIYSSYLFHFLGTHHLKQLSVLGVHRQLVV